MSLRTFGSLSSDRSSTVRASSVPIVVNVDRRQEYLAHPPLLAISGVDPALGNYRWLLVHARRIGLPVAFIRMLNESAFLKRATPSLRRIEGFEPYRNETVFGPIRACRIRSRIGQAVDFDRCVPSQPSGHYLSDTSASYALDETSADDVRRAVRRYWTPWRRV